MAYPETASLTSMDFDSLVDRLTRDFTGREWLLEQIDTWAIDRHASQYLLLTGEPGVGKSAIAAQIVRTRSDVAAFHFCVATRGGTIQPNNVLLSLAAQLVANVPGYAEALAATLRPLRLAINVEIDVDTVRDGYVQGVVINKLYTESPRETVDVVLRRPFATLDAAEPVLILIDSLDEAVTYGDDDNLVALLEVTSDFPENLRILMTTRPDETRVLSRVKHLSPQVIEIDPRSESAMKDIVIYARKRVTEEAIAARIAAQDDLGVDALVDKVAELSEGNFLYTRVLFDEIAIRGEFLSELNSLPTGIDELYDILLLRFKSRWDSAYQPILGVLVVALAPMTESELSNLLAEHMGEAKLRQQLGVLRQFLDVAQDVDGRDAYSLFHQSLQDFLVDRDRSGVYWCPPKDGHKAIVEYCWQYHPADWALCDPYGLRYFVEHLVRLSRLERVPARTRKWVDRLHDLLASESASEESIWYEAKDHVGDLEGYLADVATGARQGAELFANDPAQSVSLQCRYALMTATVSSIAENLPVELLAAFLREGLWTPAQVIAHAARIPDGWRRAEVFVDLCSEISGPERERAFDLAIQSIRTSRSSQSLDRLLQLDNLTPRELRLAWRLLEESDEKWAATSAALLAARLPEIEEPALHLLARETNPNYLRYALRDQTPWRRAPLSALYLDAIREMASDELKSETLRYIGAELDESATVPAAELALGLKDLGHRATAISALAPLLPDDLLAAALEACKECNELFTRTRGVIALVPYMPEALPTAVDFTLKLLGWGGEAPQISDLLAVAPQAIDALAPRVRRIQSPHWRARDLIALVPYDEEAVDLALDAIAEQETSGTQVEALGELWQVLPARSWNRALNIVAACEEAKDILTAIKSAAPNLEGEHAQSAVDIVGELPNLYDQACGIRMLTGHVNMEILEPLATNVVHNLRSASPEALPLATRVSSLAELAPVVDIARDATLTAIFKVQSRYQRQQIIKRIAPNLPESMFADALRAARYIGDGSEQELAYKALGKLDAQSLDRARAATRSIHGARERAAGLTDLIVAFPDLLDEVLEAIKVIRIPYNRSNALIALAPHVPEDRWPDWAAILRDIEDDTTRHATIRNAESIVPGSVLDSLVDQPKQPMARERAAGEEERPKSPQEQIADARDMVDRALDDPTLVTAAFAAIQAIPVSYAGAWTSEIERLAPLLTPAELLATKDRAYAQSDGIEGIVSGHRTSALVALAQHLPEVVEDALPGALLNTKPGYVRNLRNLAPFLTAEQRHHAAAYVQENESLEKRAEGLTALLAVEPAIGDAALEAARQIKSRYRRAEALIRLCPHLLGAIPEALEAAEGDYSQMAQILELTDYALTPALDAALEIRFVNDRDERGEALVALSPWLLALPRGRLHDAWRKILQRGAQRSRSELLKDVAAVVPIAAQLGGEAAVTEIGSAFEDVCRVWS
ncbi:MAG: NACHT domain-containing protein [Gammaproteobacteria bacterium]|nr:NACHT domain-containing protein [Gammaproteobacteria bacterium]